MLTAQLSQCGGQGSNIAKPYSAWTTGYSLGEEARRRERKGGERGRERDRNFENSKVIFSKSTKCTAVSGFAVE